MAATLESIAEVMLDPVFQMAAHHALFEFTKYGPEAMDFALSCETKDYTILQDDLAKDRAEFLRLSEEWQKRG